jgi:hypothetical protein
MNKVEELKELKIAQSHNEKSREGMAASYRKRCFKIIELETQIAEEAKPKLRDGDYGINTASGSWIRVKGKVWWIGKHSQDTASSLCDSLFIEDLVGNIIDDLKALQETVTEFTLTMGNTTPMKVDVSGSRICFKQGKDCHYVPKKNLPALILGLQQMQSTHKREAAKK